MFISRAADAFAFSRPDGLLDDLSHSIKARFWLSFYRVRAFLYSISSTLQFGIKKIMYAQARIQGGGIWGTCPPLEPNAQQKNLRRLKDLRGQIQQKSPKFSK